MSSKERIALDAMGRVKRKELSVVAAAELMGLSVRQARRVWKRFKDQGDQGLVHRLRGRTSNRRLIVGELAARPQPQRAKKPIVNNRTWKPAAGHPWKSEPARRAGPPPTLAPATPARGLTAEKRRKAG